MHKHSKSNIRDMKNFSDIQKFITDSTRVGSQIAKDHGASEVQILLGCHVDHLPPSIASGVGQLTETLMVTNSVRFNPVKKPVLRTRKFTIFNPETGKEIWPGANMDVSDSSCYFQLQVGNATNEGWGVFASWRNNNLSRVLAQFESYINSVTSSDLRGVSVLPIAKLETSGL